MRPLRRTQRNSESGRLYASASAGFFSALLAYGGDVDYRPGDRVEYIAAPVFDLIIETGEVGVVTAVEDDWV